MTPSKLVECPVCGKQVHSRGLHGHTRLKHQMIIEMMPTNIQSPRSHPGHTQVQSDSLIAHDRRKQANSTKVEKIAGFSKQKNLGTDEVKQFRRIDPSVRDKVYRDTDGRGNFTTQTLYYRHFFFHDESAKQFVYERDEKGLNLLDIHGNDLIIEGNEVYIRSVW